MEKSNDVLSLPVLNFKGDNYPLKDLTIGAMLDIEVMKSTLSNGFYGELITHKTVLSSWSLDNIDMFANLMILCPDLVQKGLKAESWRDMNPSDAMELRTEYMEKFMPWIEKRLEFLRPPAAEDTKK